MTPVSYSKSRSYWSATAGDLGQFMAVVNDTKTRWWDFWRWRVDPWFRGVSDEGHRLVPGVYRPDVPESLDEDDLRDDFTTRAWPFLSGTADVPRDDWDWYFLMQHYGILTRLLDWTEAAGVGAYFALRSQRPSNPAIWLLDPFQLNQKVARWKDAILDVSDTRLQRYLRPPFYEHALPRHPVAFLPPFKSRRIVAQKGAFTIHGESRRGLDEYSMGGHLVKVVVKRRDVVHLREELACLGITETSVFPELEGLSREVVAYWTPVEATERVKVARTTISRRQLKPQSPRLRHR